MFPDQSLAAWRLVAPFAVHNYALRTFLGRGAFCGAGPGDLTQVGGWGAGRGGGLRTFLGRGAFCGAGAGDLTQVGGASEGGGVLL